MAGLRYSIGLIPLLLTCTDAHAGGVVTATTEENLRAAMAGGGNVTFAVDGTIALTSTLLVTNNTTLDGTGHNVVLSGAGAVRVLEVQSGTVLALRRMTIADGYTPGTGQGYGGGGMLCLGSASITECTFSNNVGGGIFARGGAIFHGGALLELNRSTFLRNSSASRGGAIACDAGLFGAAGETRATNCTFYANSSVSPGGGFAASGSFANPMLFVNCTFGWNTNGAIYYLGPGAAGVQLKPVLLNSVVAYSVGLTNAMAIVDDGNNISSDDSSSFGHVTSLSNTDPLLGPAGLYGGHTMTLPLLIGSPASNMANSEAAPPTDQRGVWRPIGLRSDIGAFEGSLSTNFPVAFRFSSATYSVVEGQPSAQVAIERLGSSAVSASVQFSAHPRTAAAGEDFVPTNLTVVFGPGEVQKTIAIVILDDLAAEEDEIVLLSLQGANVEQPNAATLTVADNDLGNLITDYSDAALRRAVAAGGNYQFTMDGIVTLTNTISVTRPTVLDGTGHNVTIAGNSFRLFTVEPAGALNFRHVSLTGGQVQGAEGGLDAGGAHAQGGAIFVNGGVLTLVNCRVWTNGAAGGAGGPTSNPNLPTHGGNADGGAIYVSAGVLNATNSEFVANWLEGGPGGNNPSGWDVAGNGGEARGAAICNAGGSLNLVSNRFLGNIATGGKAGKASDSLGFAGKCGDGSGGAIYQLDGTGLVVRCVLTSNTVTSLPNPGSHTGQGGNGVGGAIGNRQGSMVINASVFSRNTARGSSPALRFGTAAGRAGAIANSDQMQVSDCTFERNTALYPPARMGAVSEGGAIANSGRLSVDRSCFAENTSSFVARGGGFAYGGAIYNSGTCALTNLTIVSNIAQGGDYHPMVPALCGAFGGAVFNAQGSIFSVNNTIVGNRSAWSLYGTTADGQGGGLSVTNGTISVLNTILAANAPGSNSFGSLVDLSHNLSSDSSCNFSANGGLDSTDPRLGPLENYGGRTLTMPLLAGSAAIDAGAAAGAPDTDQRGRTRPYASGIDIGAFESSAPFIIAGRLYGATFAGQASVSAGSISALTSDSGQFRLEGFEPGAQEVIPANSDYVFLPRSKSVTTGPDHVDVNFHAFRINALSPEGVTDGQFYVVFAGASGTSFRLLASPNMVNWEPLSTNIIGANGTFDFLLPITQNPTQFFRAVTP